ncbi:uncharacterized protein LOC144327190 [Podarcis muralis]
MRVLYLLCVLLLFLCQSAAGEKLRHRGGNRAKQIRSAAQLLLTSRDKKATRKGCGSRVEHRLCMEKAQVQFPMAFPAPGDLYDSLQCHYNHGHCRRLCFHNERPIGTCTNGRQRCCR